VGKVGAYLALRIKRCKHGLRIGQHADVAGRAGLYYRDRVRVREYAVMAIANCIMALAIVFSLLAYPSRVQAQQPAEMPKAKLAQSVMRPAPLTTSKAILAARFQEIKNQYATIKLTTAKFAPLKTTDSAELRLTRSKLNSAIYSYELYESYTQKQRDQLNLLVEMSELESLRLQMAMDRLSKMVETISKLLKKMSATGDAMI
jgi:hypothetical protein